MQSKQSTHGTQSQRIVSAGFMDTASGQAGPAEATLRKGEARRRLITEAAYQLFMRQGYHATSMRQIAEQAGITQAGLYNYFPGKEAIWQAVFMDKHPYHEILPLLQGARGESYAEFFGDAARRLVDGLGQRPHLLNLMFIELVEFKGQDIPVLYQSLLPELAHLAQVFAQKRGHLRPIPLPLLARAFAGLFFSYYVTNMMMPDQVRPLMGETSLEMFVDIFLHGILEPVERQPEEALRQAQRAGEEGLRQEQRAGEALRQEQRAEEGSHD